MSEALAMGGYAGFVWSSFGLTLAVMLACVWQARTLRQRTIRRIQSRIRATEAGK